MDVQQFKPFLGELAALSGEVILRHYQSADLAVDRKGDDSPVTEADRGAEAAIIKRIREKFPEHGVVAEESGNDREGADWTWVIDPIDGTKSFITGVPLFTTLIGLLHEGKPVLGCIHQPVLNQLCMGDNTQTTLNGKPVSVRPTRSLSECTLLASDIVETSKVQDPASWKRLTDSVRLVRTWGDGYGYLLLACGYADIMTDAILCPWDVLPVIPVVRGAGGILTSWEGSNTLPCNSAVAANPRIHRMALDVLLT